MARAFTCVAGDVEFKGSTAPAKAQIEMLHIAGRTGLITSIQQGFSDLGLVLALTQIHQEEFAALRKLCFVAGKEDLVVRASDNVPVGENLFQDNPQDFYLLVGRALVENLSPFWQLRKATVASSAEQSH
jgi:hypothetical protein